MPTEPPDGENRSVDADHVTVDVEGWSAGISLVDRGVDLHVVVIGSGADIATAGGNDARRHSTAETEWIADRHDPVANLRRVLGEFHEGKVLVAVDLDQGEIGLGIGPNHLGRVDRAVVGRNLD